MNSWRPVGWLLLIVQLCLISSSRAAPTQAGYDQIRVLEIQGTVELSPAGARTWVITQTNQILRPFDRVRTGPNSRAALRWSDSSVVPFGSLTEIEILPPHAPGAQSGLHLVRGVMSFFHRDKPGRIRVITRGAMAGIEGTDFVMATETVNNVERTTLSVIDGRVGLTNDQGFLVLTNGQQGIAVEGQVPQRIVGFVANNLLQWAFYYPAVLDLRDLPLAPQEEQALAESLAAYRSGDLLKALSKYGTRQPNSDAERVYQAALLLSVGAVPQASNALAQIQNADATARVPRLAAALRQLIAAVKREPVTISTPELPTELLAASYYEQSRAQRDVSLKNALVLANQAATNSPDFGFARARVAELEFSFGRTDKALDALNKSLVFSPRNAQALALKGFLLAAQNRPRQAIDWFNNAIAVDAALANAWLGRGLCRIRQGDVDAGREDLLIAAALEPRRAQLRSYLGKSFGDAGDKDRALHELELAKEIDPADPTSWLYSALVKAEHNRINEAIGDLEKSQALNENRAVYRSSLSLDQDSAVRSANLARIYHDAGMTDWSVREAGRAVGADYGNYSAHLFLANSYDELRDPGRINLRYETAAESEYLIANLLAPVGAGLLSQSVSQQEYSKLLQRDGFGVSSLTEYLSRGAWLQNGAQHGVWGNSSYLFEGIYRSDPGQRHNGDFEERELRLHLKHQITSKDSLYFRAIDFDAEGGDRVQYFKQSLANRELRTAETQKPILQAGYHREWAPGIHTLLLAGRLSDRFTVRNPEQPNLFIVTEGNIPGYVQPFTITENYQSRTEIYSVEGQQIWQTPKHTTIAGSRFQWGEFDTHNRQNDPVAGDSGAFFPTNRPTVLQNFSTDFERLSFYGYHYWKIVEMLQIFGGLSYDLVTFPENFRIAPLSEEDKTVHQLSPKAGFIWRPANLTAIRFAYTRSLAGAGIDQTFLLEPSQVAGFNQSFRSLIPESVGGTQTGARFDTFGLALEQRFPSRTYIGISGEILDSRVRRTLGIFEYKADSTDDFAGPGRLREHLEFTENALSLSLNQLVGGTLAFGARYRLSQAQLDSNFRKIPNSADVTDPLFRPRQNLDATLHQLGLQAIANAPCGAFVQFQALWNFQQSSGYAADVPEDNFWQLNAFAGYRFPRRRAELTIGVLNLTDKDYQLNPLTLYNELPRERTLVARFSFRF